MSTLVTSYLGDQKQNKALPSGVSKHRSGPLHGQRGVASRVDDVVASIEGSGGVLPEGGVSLLCWETQWIRGLTGNGRGAKGSGCDTGNGDSIRGSGGEGI
ncbi:hypothetical protein Tco_0401082 [Tanacetum coccineum]